MKKIKYSQDYRDKIRIIKKDLDTRFDKDVRLAVFKKINDRIQSIKENEEIGISVREMFGVDTDYQVIYAAKNYIFFRIELEEIFIVNIYNEREDFMWKLFGIRTTSQETEDYWKE